MSSGNHRPSDVLLASFLFFCCLCVAEKATAWSYDNPVAWAETFPACESFGQSPVRLESPEVASAKSGSAVATHQMLTPVYHDTDGLKLKHTPSGLQADGAFGYLQYSPSERYQAVRLQLHFPSEHMIDQRRFAAELQIVHERQTPFGPAQLIVAVLLYLGSGHNSSSLLSALGAPFKVEQDVAIGSLNLGVELATVLRGGFMRYDGSLTSPPCSGMVRWVVLSQPLTVSHAQVNAFQSLFPKGNSRPSHSLGNRKVSHNLLCLECGERSKMPYFQPGSLQFFLHPAGAIFVACQIIDSYGTPMAKEDVALSFHEDGFGGRTGHNPVDLVQSAHLAVILLDMSEDSVKALMQHVSALEEMVSVLCPAPPMYCVAYAVDARPFDDSLQKPLLSLTTGSNATLSLRKQIAALAPFNSGSNLHEGLVRGIEAAVLLKEKLREKHQGAIASAAVLYVGLGRDVRGLMQRSWALKSLAHLGDDQRVLRLALTLPQESVSAAAPDIELLQAFASKPGMALVPAAGDALGAALDSIVKRVATDFSSYHVVGFCSQQRPDVYGHTAELRIQWKDALSSTNYEFSSASVHFSSKDFNPDACQTPDDLKALWQQVFSGVKSQPLNSAESEVESSFDSDEVMASIAIVGGVFAALGLLMLLSVHLRALRHRAKLSSDSSSEDAPAPQPSSAEGDPEAQREEASSSSCTCAVRSRQASPVKDSALSMSPIASAKDSDYHHEAAAFVARLQQLSTPCRRPRLKRASPVPSQNEPMTPTVSFLDLNDVSAEDSLRLTASASSDELPPQTKSCQRDNSAWGNAIPGSVAEADIRPPTTAPSTLARVETRSPAKASSPFAEGSAVPRGSNASSDPRPMFSTPERGSHASSELRVLAHAASSRPVCNTPQQAIGARALAHTFFGSVRGVDEQQET